MRAEVRLKVPNMKDRAKDSNGYPIDHSEMRFRKVIELEKRPQIGDALSLSTRSGDFLPATVSQVEIDEARELFVLSCQFGRRAITASEYASLATDPDWQLKHLLDR